MFPPSPVNKVSSNSVWLKSCIHCGKRNILRTNTEAKGVPSWHTEHFESKSVPDCDSLVLVASCSLKMIQDTGSDSWRNPPPISNYHLSSSHRAVRHLLIRNWNQNCSYMNLPEDSGRSWRSPSDSAALARSIANNGHSARSRHAPFKLVYY